MLDYAAGWPRLESASGVVVIDRVGLTSVENKGSIGGIPFSDAEIRVPNMFQSAALEIVAADRLQLAQILNFIRQTPVAARLGSSLADATASGDVTSGIEMRIPLTRPQDYQLTGRFALEGARLGMKGSDFGLTALEGTVDLNKDRLRAKALTGRFGRAGECGDTPGVSHRTRIVSGH